MPIKINLLTEAFAEDELRRRDPVKQAMYLVAGFVILTLVWFSSSWLQYRMAQSTLGDIEGQIQLRTNANAMVQEDFKSIGESKRRLDALSQLSSNRFLNGDLLNALQTIYVPNVQLIRLKLDQSFEVKEGTPARTNAIGILPARPSSAVGKTTLTLDARDSSTNPGDQVNHYKDALANNAFFSARLEKTNSIRLSNLSPPQSSGTGKPFVLFTLDCPMIDKTP